MPPRIYLDHAAATPVRPEACRAVAEGMARWANPSSPHAEGRAARAALEDARARIKAALGWPHDLIFTSGASEAVAIGLGRAKAGRRLISAVEHDAVVRAAPGAERLPVAGGRVDRAPLVEALWTGGPAVVAIQHVNSETGTVLLNDEASLIAEAGSILLVDCAQSTGKLPLPDADLLVVSAHKLGGPPGVGALLVRDLGLLEPSGGQESGYRGGTENLPGALGFAAAAEAAGMDGWLAGPARLRRFRAELQEIAAVVTHAEHCDHILAVTHPDLAAVTQLIQLDLRGIAVSAGSACASGTLKRSPVLAAFGLQEAEAERTIRVSPGWSTTAAELDVFVAAYAALSPGRRSRAA